MARETGRRYVRRSATQWARLVAEQAESGLSQRAFCARRRIAYGSFCGWRRKLQGESPSTRDETAFLEVEVQPDLEAGWDVELDLGEGVVLRMRRR
jgi:putative transposase